MCNIAEGGCVLLDMHSSIRLPHGVTGNSESRMEVRRKFGRPRFTVPRGARCGISTSRASPSLGIYSLSCDVLLQREFPHYLCGGCEQQILLHRSAQKTL